MLPVSYIYPATQHKSRTESDQRPSALPVEADGLVYIRAVEPCNWICRKLYIFLTQNRRAESFMMPPQARMVFPYLVPDSMKIRILLFDIYYDRQVRRYCSLHRNLAHHFHQELHQK